MGRLHDLALANYDEQLARVCVGVDPSSNPRHTRRMMSVYGRTYGHLVAGLPPGSRVLDLGCGGGLLLAWLASHPHVVPVGVDITPALVDAAQRAVPRAEAHCEDGLAFLRRHPNTFAGIFCMDVLEHLPEADQCLEWAEAALAALVPGGFFVCGGPNAANLTAGYHRFVDVTHYRAFTYASLFQLLGAAGFRDLNVVPIRPVRWIARARHLIEHLLHRCVFLVCNVVPRHPVFSMEVFAMGRRPPMQAHEGLETSRSCIP